ncbi:MAG: cytochrome c family protein [Pseudomonadota bacterium]
MGDLTLNKVLGALLAVALGVMGLRELSYQLFPSPSAHHDDHGEPKSLNEQIAETYAYYVPVADTSAGGGEEEPVFDLGLALAAADVSRGERSFLAKCSTCHSIEEGGGNGTGPALWNSIGVPKASHAGFNYSNALSEIGGEWTYENMNDWLYNPAAYARGTSMAFAGLRRDDERANVMAYLAQMSENPPPFPASLAAESETATEDGATLEDASIEVMEEIETSVEDTADAITDVLEDVTEELTDPAE